ncbi:MAG: hypothetical protein IH868_05110 [Chloroflexi bacterium]|nr:hypothetical protein [Chloroflexota bacterium]
MAGITLLEPPVAARTDRSEASIMGETDEFGRAVIDSVISGKALSFSLEISSEARMLGVSARLERFLMVITARSGGSSARVAPRFMADTYPAMVELTRRLPAGWASEGDRTVRFGLARQLFVSVDRPVPVAGATFRPNRLLEVAAAHRVDQEWFRTRVLPRTTRSRRLTTVYYGTSDAGQTGLAGESIYSQAARHHRELESMDGVQRHFVADAIVERGNGWIPDGLPAAV